MANQRLARRELHVAGHHLMTARRAMLDPDLEFADAAAASLFDAQAERDHALLQLALSLT